MGNINMNLHQINAADLSFPARSREQRDWLGIFEAGRCE
jgi:hypothetical protein